MGKCTIVYSPSYSCSLTEECLEIHKLVYHGDQQFEAKVHNSDRDKSGGPKYTDEKGNKSPT